MTNDYISRQDAIDAINETIAQYIPYLTRETNGIPLEVAIAIKRLPSAQPERGCDECVFKPFKQFQPERKKGEWIDQDDGSYYPVECSECRKIPLFDVDGDYVLSNFCPNCGAEMRGEKDE